MSEVIAVDLFIKPKRKVDRVFIHCSASDNPKHDDVKVIRKWHMSPDPNDRSKPWSDIGYHYYIKKDGSIQRGRSIEKIPAAQAGHNRNTIAICLGGLKKEYFTEEQFRSLRTLCNLIANSLPDVTFHGHCEVSAKECPVFNYRKVLGLNSFGKIT